MFQNSVIVVYILKEYLGKVIFNSKFYLMIKKNYFIEIQGDPHQIL